jgi:hypothetical protein
MEFKLKLEKEDWRAFNGYLFKKLSAKNKTVFDNFFINVSVWMTIGFVIMYTAKQFGGLHWPTAAITSIVFLLLYSLIFAKHKKLQTAIEPMENGSFCRELTYKFSEEGISTKDGIVSWDLILQIERAEGMIMLYLDTAFALVFPEQKLEQPDEFYDYVSSLHSNVSNQ